MSSKIIKIEALQFPWQTDDPFLFCAYHLDRYPKGAKNMGPAKELLQGRNLGNDFIVKDGWRMYHGDHIPGFPFHPHRGFETITINKQGVVDHTDSLGAAGRFMAGDVQWMTAGRGLQHSEMFPLLNPDKDNTLEIFQIWLNLPKVKKMVPPDFKMLWREDIPAVKLKDQQGKQTTINVIAGSLVDLPAPAPPKNSWAAQKDSGVNIFTVQMQAGAQWVLPPKQAGSSRSVYFYKGEALTVESEKVEVMQRVVLKSDESIDFINGKEAGFLLILEGKPINEPVAQYGPFVMNTQEEIQQAFAEYQRTQFGGWPWPKTEQVHPISKGRFALFANGKEQNRN